MNLMLEVLEFYLTNLQTYYIYFHKALQCEEADILHKIQVTSQVADYLSKLLSFTEQVMIDTEVIHEMVVNWKTAMDIKEQQELYN